MPVHIKQTCPQEVIEKLLQWEKKGWLTVDLTEELENDVEVWEPQTSVTKEESSQRPIEVLWVERLKSIAKELSKSLDNQVVITNRRGYPGSYKFKFNSKAFCNMMDELLNNYSSDIKAYLHDTRKPTGVTFVFPFLGEILNAHLFNGADLQKKDLKPIFESFKYNGRTAVSKLSTNGKFTKNKDAVLLVEKAKMIGKKYV